MINPTVEDLEYLFPQLERHFGVVKFLNGGARPKQINYLEEVPWPRVLLCALGEHLCPLIGRLITTDNVLALCKHLQGPVANWFESLSHDATLGFRVDLVDNGCDHELWALWTGAKTAYNVSNGTFADLANIPTEAHIYDLGMIQARLLHRVNRLKLVKDVANDTAKPRDDDQGAVAESGHVCNDAGCHSAGPVRDGVSVVDAGNVPNGTSG